MLRRVSRPTFLVPAVLALVMVAPPASATITSSSVSPPHPSDADPVTIGAEGYFPDYCWQVTDIVCGSQPGGLITIDVYAVYYNYGSCPPVVVNYSSSCPQGLLAPGLYSVRVAEHHEICDIYGCVSYPFAEVRTDAFSVSGTVGVDGPAPGDRLTLEPPRPNPFFRETALSFVVPAGSAEGIELAILDVTGRHVRRLHVADARPGRHEVGWDGLGDDGSAAPAGVYFFGGSISGRPVRIPVVLLR